MTPSEQVRKYAFDRYIQPARSSGKQTVTIRAGDIHKALQFAQRSALVCGALGSLIFCTAFARLSKSFTMGTICSFTH